jgi:hypothetical protein
VNERDDSAALFWQWADNKDRHTLTLEELQRVRAYAECFFPASLDLIDWQIRERSHK